MAKYTEKDLDNLIDSKLNDCKGLPNVCKMLQNDEGKKRIAQRVKEIILNDGIHDVEAALTHIESQLFFEID